MKFLAYVVVSFVMFLSAYAWDSASCSSRASKMGMPKSWGPLQGCMIEYKPGKWIDIDRYRAIDE